jgi:hypothetical protein
METNQPKIDVLKELTIADIQSVFPKSASENVKRNWPCVASCLRSSGFAEDPVMVFYAIATIRAETGTFSPSEESASQGSKGRDGRRFGQYDQVAQKANGRPNIRFNPDKTLRLTTSSLGNRAHLGGSYMDPDVSGENTWRDLKGMPRRDLDDATENDGELFKGRGFVQLTGRRNYTDAGRTLGIDLVNKPELAAQADAAAKILVWYLKQHQKEISQNLKLDPKNYVDARAAVNGKNQDGTVNGLHHFSTAYDLIESVFDKKQAEKKKKNAPVKT